MEKLLNKLNSELYVVGIKKKHLADIWGCKPSVVTDVFKGRITISFSYLIKTLQTLKKNEKNKHLAISKYLESAKAENINEAMEYFSLKGDFKSLISAIEKAKDTGNKEWAEVYELILEKYTTDPENPEKRKNLFKRVKEKNTKVKSDEMKTLIEILLCQSIFQSGNYHLLSKQLEEIYIDIEGITNKYIKCTFGVKLNEATAVISLQQGDVQTTRKACLDVFKMHEADSTFSIPNIIALGKYGESYFFENYHIAMKYLTESINEIDKLIECAWSKDKKEKVLDTIRFLKVYHWIDIEGLEKELKGTELAFFKVRQGKFKEAEEILLELERKDGSLSEIATFVLALARNNDEELLKKSLRMCEERTNIFYSYLPKKYLGLT